MEKELGGREKGLETTAFKITALILSKKERKKGKDGELEKGKERETKRRKLVTVGVEIAGVGAEIARVL
jgi:hypothetical protein